MLAFAALLLAVVPSLLPKPVRALTTLLALARAS
jgi:hypothetical protein